MQSEKSRRNLAGIARNRYDDFLKSKGKKILAKKRFSKASLKKAYDDDDLIKSTLLSYSTKSSEIELSDLSEPDWMNDYRKCCMLLSEVESIKQEIKLEKAKKLTAINQQRHIKAIQMLNQQASTKINRCEKILKGFERTADLGDTAEERKIFANVLMSLAMNIRDSAKELRQSQQEDLTQARQLQKMQGKVEFSIEADKLMNKDPQDSFLQFTQQGFQSMEQQLAEERNEQILKIVSSIHSLNSVYKELQTLVIQQGSLLDRIDQNIDNTAFNIKTANEHLAKAEEHQKSPLANRIMAIIIFLIIVCCLILIFR